MGVFAHKLVGPRTISIEDGAAIHDNEFIWIIGFMSNV